MKDSQFSFIIMMFWFVVMNDNINADADLVWVGLSMLWFVSFLIQGIAQWRKEPS